MIVVHTLTELRRTLSKSQSCALVPTMGNLHDGHLALVREAAQHNVPTVVSIFVNRLQFLPHEDFDQYPRTLIQDCDMLAKTGCDVVFAPSEAELYPEPQLFTIQPPPALANILEGEYRPGFFSGVCTVVLKLFACTQARVAVFGQKDYQQLAVIRSMVRQLALPITIIGVPTKRDPMGLALSSRNGYLTDEQRAQAPKLGQVLRWLAEQRHNTTQSLDALEARALQNLTEAGWEPDYLTLRRRNDLLRPADSQRTSSPLVALGAARLGQTRLIDNFEC